MSDYICIQCGYEGRRKAKKKGSTTLEIVLWVVFLIPGPFYSLWRIFSKEYVCPMCNEKSMFSLNSAVGQRKLALLEQEINDTAHIAPATPQEQPPETKPLSPRETEDETVEAPPSIRNDDNEAPRNSNEW